LEFHGEAVVADLRQHLEGGVEDLALTVALDTGAEVGCCFGGGHPGPVTCRSSE
jgi:hypothetical protein